MPDMVIWKGLVLEEVKSIADEEQQRKAWFGKGPWVDSPVEQFCAFFDNASVPEFLVRSDNGLNKEQASQLTRLTALMRHLSDSTPGPFKAADLIDDPRWQEIRKQAAITFSSLASQA